MGPDIHGEILRATVLNKKNQQLHLNKNLSGNLCKYGFKQSISLKDDKKVKDDYFKYQLSHNW